MTRQHLEKIEHSTHKLERYFKVSRGDKRLERGE